MKKTIARLVILFVLIAAGLAYWLSRTTPAQRLARYKSDMSQKGGRVFEATLHGVPVAFLLQDCSVYLLNASGDSVRRTKVLSTEFYLGFTVCSRQSIHADDDYVQVTLGKTAIGAGGCCAAGGNYRSKDGRAWEKDMPKGWRPLEEAQP